MTLINTIYVKETKGFQINIIFKFIDITSFLCSLSKWHCSDRSVVPNEFSNWWASSLSCVVPGKCGQMTFYIRGLREVRALPFICLEGQHRPPGTDARSCIPLLICRAEARFAASPTCARSPLPILYILSQVHV